jgi:hypothetical protein
MDVAPADNTLSPITETTTRDAEPNVVTYGGCKHAANGQDAEM